MRPNGYLRALTDNDRLIQLNLINFNFMSYEYKVDIMELWCTLLFEGKSPGWKEMLR